MRLRDIQGCLRDPRLLGGPLLPTLNVKLVGDGWHVVLWDSNGGSGTGTATDLEVAVRAAFADLGIAVPRETVDDPDQETG